MVSQITPPATRQPPQVSWEKLPDDFVLPGNPIEKVQQPYLAETLTDALGAAGLIEPEMIVVSNLGLVAIVDQKTIIKAPDWLWIPSVIAPDREPSEFNRRSYTPLIEGKLAKIVMEFLSETEAGEYSTRPTFPYGKLYFYEQILQVPTYVTFDPAAVVLEVRHSSGRPLR